MALKGIRVIEFAGLAPAPFCGMVLADFGATVIRIDKAKNLGMDVDCLGNGKLSIAVDLKHPEGIKIIKKLSETSDVLVEPFRAGVMEKLGLGPSALMGINKRLIYARLSGYGQTGPMAHKAGHDINYLSLSGLLSQLCWENEKPTPPINLAADFGGGGLMTALGIVMALYERSVSGLGQVVECDMVGGAAYMASWIYRSKLLPIWGNQPGNNMLDGGSHFYNTYETKDGKWMAVGAIEPQFYKELLKGLGLSLEDVPQYCEDGKRILQEKFKEHTQDYWIKVFKELDACVTPVLSIEEANMDKSWEGYPSPSALPHLLRTPPKSLASSPPIRPGQHSSVILKQLGYSEIQIQELCQNKVILDNQNASKL